LQVIIGESGELAVFANKRARSIVTVDHRNECANVESGSIQPTSWPTETHDTRPFDAFADTGCHIGELLVDIGEQLTAHSGGAHCSNQHSGEKNQANTAKHKATPEIGGASFTLSTGWPMH